MSDHSEAHGPKKKLGEWHATAICGNDITSSCLYVSALALMWAGPLAPISLVLVALVLWLFRGIYAEVVGALPLNGGAYNALLNTTSKFRASVAACLTILSYLATAVISASEAVHYGNMVLIQLDFPKLENGEVLLCTVALLGLFAILTIRGIRESSEIALGIFLFHIFALLTLLVVGTYAISQHGVNLFFSNLISIPPRPSMHPLFLGFAVAMLGISGFESSADFVEEQADGVFPKTLRNMWTVVSFFNPLICLLALGLVPLAEVPGHQEALLAHLGQVSGGAWLNMLVSVDASIVLSGAVLTSYIGVTGLIHRMTIDRCLPQFFLAKSRYGTYYRIITCYFVLCSLLLYLAESITTLAGVYTIAFLMVMGLFAIGNMLLKIKRERLPRPQRVWWITSCLGLLAVSLALIGNVVLDTKSVRIFALYFAPSLALVVIMLERTDLLRLGISVIREVNKKVASINNVLTRKMRTKLDQINSQEVVFFTRGEDPARINQAMLYILDNEHTNKVRIVTVRAPNTAPMEKIYKDIEFIDRIYPDLNIEFIPLEGEFGPELLQSLSKEWKIPLNFMFIGAPGDKFPHSLSDLGGVRLII